MRTRTWLVLIPVLAAAAGSVTVGCGDDTSPTGVTGTEGGSPESSSGGGGDATKTETSTGGDAAKEGGDAAKEAAACMDASFNVATFDSGSPVWACYQTNCAKDDAGGIGTLPACAADCTCNSAFAAALLCVADGGQNSTCFTPQISAAGMLGASWLSGCFVPFMGMCGGGDAGPSDSGDAAPTEGGGEGGTDTGTTDAGTDGATD